MFSTSLSNPTEEGLLYQKICLTHYERSFCDDYFSNTINHVQKYSKIHKRRIVHNATHDEDKIQREASKWIMYTQMAMSLPSVVTTLIYGSWSDSVSRKYPIILSLCGIFISNLFYMLISFDIERYSLSVFLIPSFIIGLFGASNTLFSSVFSYVSHSTDENDRTLHLAFLESCIMIGGAVGLATSGLAIEKLGFFNTFVIVFIAILVSIVYTLTNIKDIQPDYLKQPLLTKEKTPVVKSFCDCTYLKDALAVCFVPRPKKTNLFIFLFTCSFMLSSFVTIGEASIVYIYLRRSSISLTQTEYGYYRAFRTLLLGISLLIVLPLLKRLCNVSDMFCIIIGTISRSFVDLIYAFAREKYQIFLIPIFGMFTSYIITAIRSFLSKMVTPSEEGKLFAVVSSLEMINLFLATLTFNLLYTWSLTHFTGFVFIVSFIIHLFTIPLFVSIIKCSDNKIDLVDDDDDEFKFQMNTTVILSEKE